ncbi:unnamed protein product [Phytophthora fragariaefolia]|uniref:Unnamed protein product n=1 Tax=Phytophthora fragariaefolia TaxID=1490495 RepID=A0A9W6TXJ0_9STRA|nr:unnamed protein product [Phytophthora fragariaefolia]
MAATSSTPKGGAPSVMAKFLGMLRNYREPVTDAEVRDYFKAEGGGGYEQLPDVINALLGEGKIKIFKKGSVLSYGIVDAEEAERIRGLTCEIERAGNKGIWTRDIKSHTNIPQVGRSAAADDDGRGATKEAHGWAWLVVGVAANCDQDAAAAGDASPGQVGQVHQ